MAFLLYSENHHQSWCFQRVLALMHFWRLETFSVSTCHKKYLYYNIVIVKRSQSLQKRNYHKKTGGILICCLNGSGKTTLGRVLAEKIGFRHFDIEQYYFPEPNSYTQSHTREEVAALLYQIIKQV